MNHMSRPQLLQAMKSKRCELEFKQEQIYTRLCCEGLFQFHHFWSYLIIDQEKNRLQDYCLLNQFDCNLGEWNVKYGDCYSQCGLKGGTCSYCNNGYLEGYCCRKDGYGGNGDCPQSAIQSIPNDKKYHLCVSRHKSRHFNKSIRIKKKFSH